MELSTLYWILILPNLGSVISGLAWVGLIVFVIGSGVAFMIFDMDRENEKKKGILLAMKKFIPAFVAAILITDFIPTEKQMMYMIGGYAVTNVENIEKLPKNVVNAANKFLEQYSDKEEKK